MQHGKKNLAQSQRSAQIPQYRWNTGASHCRGSIRFAARQRANPST